MSFAQPFSESHSIQTMIQKEKMDGRDGTLGSPILEGVDNPPMEAGSVPMHPIPVLEPRRTRIHTRTDSLERKYASTGTNKGKEPGHKDYGASTIGRKNLRG